MEDCMTAPCICTNKVLSHVTATISQPTFTRNNFKIHNQPETTMSQCQKKTFTTTKLSQFTITSHQHLTTHKRHKPQYHNSLSPQPMSQPTINHNVTQLTSITNQNLTTHHHHMPTFHNAPSPCTTFSQPTFTTNSFLRRNLHCSNAFS